MEEKVDPKPNDDLVNKKPVNVTVPKEEQKLVEVPKGHEQPKCQLQVMCEHGVGFQTRTPMSQLDIVDEIETKGGVSKTGYATIITQPKPDQVAEVLRVNRQKIIGYLITVLGDGGNSRQPMIHVPTDEAVMKVSSRR